VVLLVVAAIVHGSLYPWQFSVRNGPDGPFALLASTWQDWDHGTDLAANLIFYFPLGFFLPGALPGPRRRACLAAVPLATALSCAMELLQFYIPGRVTSMGDVDADTLGAACGALVAGGLGLKLSWWLLGDLAADLPALLVLGAWAGARLYPYVPEADLHQYWRAVRDLVLAPRLDPLDLLRYAASWLALAAIVERVYGLRRWLVVFPLLLAGEFCARAIVHGSTLKLADLAGGGGAFVVWALLLRWLPGRLGLAGVLLAVAVGILRLAPFSFGAAQKPFGWTPLLSLMVGSMNVAIPTFMEKMFFYGAAIYLLWRSGLNLALTAAGMAALLLATSYLEVFLPDRSAEITDALLALIVGLGFALAPPAVSAATARPE